MTAITSHIDRTLDKAATVTARLKGHGNASIWLQKPVAGVDLAARAVRHVWHNRRYLTLIKLLNMALINFQFVCKTERVFGRPYKMKIEPTNICNTHCQLCPTGLGLPGRPKGKMELEKVQRLIDRFRRHLVSLDLSMWGDPLIVPNIYQMIRYAHDRGIWTYLSTNLHAYKLAEQRKPGQKSQAELLVESGLDLLTCSLHGASQATYAQYQPGKNFDQAVAKIREIIETRDRLGSSTPQVQLNFVVMKQNEHEREAFTQLAAELGCKAIFSMPAMNARFSRERVGPGLPEHAVRSTCPGKPGPTKSSTARTASLKHHLNQWLPKDKSYRLPVYDQMLAGDYRGEKYNGHKDYFCDWLWRQAVINWDGQVSTCCGSFDPKEDMGNVFNQSFGKIWNGKKYRMARRSFTRPLTAEQAKDNPCATCPGFMV